MDAMEPKDLLWSEIKIGDAVSFSVQWSTQDIETFAKLSGDYNPIHLDSIYAATTKFRAPIVHGMLIASLVSRLIGMFIPGKRCLLLKNEIAFKKPVYVDDKVILTGIVDTKSDSTKILSINFSFCRNEDIVAEGRVLVTVL